MHGSTDQEPEEPRTDGGQAVVADEGPAPSPPSDPSRRVTTWELVPGERADTVPVRWSDLKAMRARIDELETELERSRTRRRRTVERYERLLDRGGAWGHSVPRAPEASEDEGEGETAASEENEDREKQAPTPSGPLGRVLAAVGAVLGR